MRLRLTLINPKVNGKVNADFVVLMRLSELRLTLAGLKGKWTLMHLINLRR